MLSAVKPLRACRECGAQFRTDSKDEEAVCPKCDGTEDRESLARFREYVERPCDNPEHFADDELHTVGVVIHPAYGQHGGRELAGDLVNMRDIVSEARRLFREWYREELRVGHRYDHKSRHIPADPLNDVASRIAHIAYSLTSHLASDDLLLLALSAKPGVLTEYPARARGLEDELSVLEIIEINLYQYIVDELTGQRINMDDELRVERIVERQGHAGE